MSPTDVTRAAALAAAFFDEVLVPLAEGRRAAGAAPYFPRRPEASATTYFSRPALRTMQASSFELPGGGTAEGLLDALAHHWQARGEPELAALVPHLRELARALAEASAEHDGTVDVLCYTLF